MQLQEILSLLKTTPMHFNILMTVSFVLAILFFFFAALKYSNDREDKKLIFSAISMIIFLIAGIGALAYTENAKDSAIKEATITRSEDTIHIESNSEFMKSADLDVVAEKDGYIYVEFDNKTYRIEDLSKKGN